jgi:NAD(P)-dependent dehydrogenase (short-subunit alcohol dehydrogenase family)
MLKTPIVFFWPLTLIFPTGKGRTRKIIGLLATPGLKSPACVCSVYQMNLRTALIASRAALPLFRTSGVAIVNIGAAAARKAGLGMGAYAASKAGVARMTESLAEELKDKKIRVNAVLPSIIDTPANRKEMPDAAFDRWVTPASLAGVIKFLLSPAARDITGAVIPVTGRV